MSKTDSPEIDLKPYTSQIFKENDENTPKILYSAYFRIPKCKNCHNKVGKESSSSTVSPQSSLSAFSNVYLTCGPFYEIDYDQSIMNAYEIFKKLYPNDEFLPRAPDPEEIIIGDEDPTAIPDGDDVDEKKTYVGAPLKDANSGEMPQNIEFEKIEKS